MRDDETEQSEGPEEAKRRVPESANDDPSSILLRNGRPVKGVSGRERGAAGPSVESPARWLNQLPFCVRVLT
jgi:hypothetical protein